MTPWCRTHGFTETAPLKHEKHIPVKAYDIVPVHPRDGNGPKLIDPRAMTPRISKHKVTTASMTHAFSRAQGSRPKLPAEQQDQAEQQEQEQQSTTKHNKEQQRTTNSKNLKNKKNKTNRKCSKNNNIRNFTEQMPRVRDAFVSRSTLGGHHPHVDIWGWDTTLTNSMHF